jgi:hypothetical protein
MTKISISFLLARSLSLISKDKRSPAARQDKRYLVRQGAAIFKKETIR